MDYQNQDLKYQIQVTLDENITIIGPGWFYYDVNKYILPLNDSFNQYIDEVQNNYVEKNPNYQDNYERKKILYQQPLIQNKKAAYDQNGQQIIEQQDIGKVIITYNDKNKKQKIILYTSLISVTLLITLISLYKLFSQK